MYSNKKQEKSAAVWKFLLEEAQRMLSETQDKVRRKELRYSVRAFRSLLRERAILPNAAARAVDLAFLR
jgi:triphosphoribosyl-dephospho-CoA synthetase